ncbi:MAG: hypothetical protein KF861_21590, partial [Planctomycetaceae bacterium]|nr:hypothetical protein [Planctomycetaceae bacterium]
TGGCWGSHRLRVCSSSSGKPGAFRVLSKLTMLNCRCFCLGGLLHHAMLILALSCALAAGRSLAQEITLDYLMLSDPAFDVPPVETVLPDGAIRLWKDTLSRPESDLVKAAADSIAAAHQSGLAGPADCRPELLAALRNDDLDPLAAYAVCRTLILLDAQDAADELFSWSQRAGTSFRLLIEPALATWDYGPIREHWRSRLSDAETFRRELLLACDGTARVQDEAALPLLLKIVHRSSLPDGVRLSASRAAGQIATNGLEPDAQRLLGRPSRRFSDELCAVALLLRHESPAAQEILLSSAAHANPTVAAPALRRLLEIDPSLVLPLADASLQNKDPKVRQCGLDAYIARPTSERIPRIAVVMDDPHPQVRAAARSALHRFSQQPEFADTVRNAAMDVLAQNSWRGQEQAAYLLAVCDYKPAAARLVELLDVQRPEVMASAAWGLRKLAVPETKEGVFRRAERVSADVLKTRADLRQPGEEVQLAHLFEALVVLQEERIVPTMRRHVPKDVTREASRSAAIWGLGRFLEGQPDEGLTDALIARIQDIESDPPELEQVRRMCAVTIGRMQVTSRLLEIQFALGRRIPPSSVAYALAWAVERLGGEAPEKMPPYTQVHSGWLLEPVEAKASPLGAANE